MPGAQDPPSAARSYAFVPLPRPRCGRGAELGERLEPAFEGARRHLAALAKSGASEARTLGTSLFAGWEELRRTHRELSREAEHERTKEGQGSGS